MRVSGNFVLKEVVVGVAGLSIFFAICGPPLRAQPRPDFSGHYIHRADKSPYVLNSLTVRLTVTQNAETLEVVMTFEGGKSTTSRYALDGAETSNMTVVGVPTKDRVKFKGKRMIITTQASSVTPSASFEMTREWELSPDLQTLTIKSRVHYPVDRSLDRPSSDKYARE